ncbi:hypothetical protein IG197_34520 (plasmid) [Aminobacter sp. SR38]|jgi:hypothetical protein|uniref:hypothetical protein n=1 Tax=Aminobacter sp. SR38 TaxID=2774562 RepID=UPI00177D2C5C|nr:hypothetical protein [Aminobacter sp. SR38]QOF75489.1 hypothetical protein IG197_34520 [Aminobacter sp. SR38]
MAKRQTLMAQTVLDVAAQIAGQPVDEARAERYAAIHEPILQAISGLRAMPLKNIEPAILFRPVGGSSNE